MAIQECSSIHQTTSKLYHRLLISGTIYTSSAYMRSKTRKDSVLCFKRGGEKSFGNAKCYVSFCTNDCIGCTQPCKHVVIVNLYSILPINLSTDNITGATARHIHCVQPLRHVYSLLPLIYFIFITIFYYSETKAFFTSEISNKCIYMKFSSPEIIYIIEQPNSKERNL